MKAPILKQIERRKKVAEIFRSCLKPYDLQGEVDERELYIGNVITENTGNKKRISKAVLDSMFPWEPAPCELHHYTSIVSLSGIASSNELRLYAVRKRIGQGELDTFALKHGLTGYLNSAQGEAIYEELSDDIFYTSFTRLTPKDEQQMWRVFADGGKGVRLQFRVEPVATDAELRAIQYSRSSRTLLNEVNDRLASEGEPPFVPWTLSRIGAFYLPSSLQDESEVRLMIKRQGGRNEARSDGSFEYWPVPMGVDNDVCRLDVTAICAGPNSVRTDIDAAVAGSSLAAVSITGP